MFRRLARLTVFGASILGCSSSDHVCTEIACDPQTSPHISVRGAGGGALPAGMYEIRVTTEAGATGATCDRTPSAMVTGCISNSPTLQVTDGATLELVVSGDPKTIRVYVSIDGTEVAAHSFTAKYQDREVNGPGCGYCRIVTVTPEPKIEL